MKLNDLQTYAATMGVRVEAEKDDYGWGYWLVDEDGSGLWPDDNFCTSLEEVEMKLDAYAEEMTEQATLICFGGV